MALADTLTFIRRLAARPGRVGAVAPSGPALARAITDGIDASHAPVVEFGPGTGVFTRALIERGVPEEALVLIETDPEFVRVLARRFPRARLLHADIGEPGRRREIPHLQAGAVVSGLPLLSMPREKVRSIVGLAVGMLRPGAAIHQFTYRPMSPVPADLLAEFGLTARRTGCAFANVPPAFVFRFERSRVAARQ